MEQFKIVEMSPGDEKVHIFRQNVISEDLNIKFDDLSSCTTRHEIYDRYMGHPELEEVYKFSDLKWKQTSFDSIYGLEFENQIVSIAGKKVYANEFVRLGMHYYTLKKFRKSIRSILWKKNGFIDAELKKSPHNHFFITIYAHNKKLDAWSQKLLKRKNFGQMSIDNTEIIDCLNKFNPIGLVKFNNVPQLLLHFSPARSDLPNHFYQETGVTV